MTFFFSNHGGVSFVLGPPPPTTHVSFFLRNNGKQAEGVWSRRKNIGFWSQEMRVWVPVYLPIHRWANLWLYCTLQGCPRMQRAVWNALLSPGRALRTPRAGDTGLGLHYGHTAPFPGVPDLLGPRMCLWAASAGQGHNSCSNFLKKLVPPRSLLIDA